MESMRKEIEGIIGVALKKAGIEAEDIKIEHPADVSHGDYSTNVAMQYAPQIKRNPKDFAEELVLNILQNKAEEIEKAEVAGSGFINFFLSKKIFYTKFTEHT